MTKPTFNNKSSHMDKTLLLSRINKLTPWGLMEIEKAIKEIEKTEDIAKDMSSSKLKNQEVIIRLLDKLKKDPNCGLLHVKLSKYIQENWPTIKEKKLLSHFLIDSLKRFETIDNSSILHERISRGSNSGSYFEDLFALIINWYLSSQTSLWNKKGQFKLKIEVNKSMIIPGNLYKKKADIIISDQKTNKVLLILELKKSFTKSSLKKTYHDEFSEYSKLDPQLKYLFVIFQSSKTKTKTYKQVPGCRVICNDYGLWEKSIDPAVIDSVELILEEIYIHLSQNKRS